MSYQKIAHYMNYCALYKGNFIESLLTLQNRLNNEHKEVMYIFAITKDQAEHISWISDLAKENTVIFSEGSFAKDVIKFRRFIKDKKIDIVHTHFLSLNQYMRMLIASAGCEIKLVLHVHNHMRHISNPVCNKMRQILYSKTTMIACGPSVYKGLEEDFPKCRKFEVNNGIFYNRLDDYVDDDRNEYGLKKTDTVCLIFGFDFYRKGVDLAIQAIEKVRRTKENVYLLISLSTNKAALLEDIKKITGEVPEWIHVIKARNDVATLYNMADIFLSPSREEGLPYSAIEAGYSRCDVILSDIEAQSDLKIPYAVWFSNENVDEFANAILKIIDGTHDKQKNIKNVKDTMRNEYSLTQWAEEIHSVYDVVEGK